MAKKKNQKDSLKRLDPNVQSGLTVAEVEERVRLGCVNAVEDKQTKSTGQVILGNLFTFFNMVLLAIASVFLFFVIYLTAIGRTDIVNQYFGFSKFVFLIPAVMNVTMGSAQEIHSMNVIRKLRIVTLTKCRVVRDGETRVIEADKVVLDDIVQIHAGDQAVADLIVKDGEVFVDESMLTGESDHVRKTPGDTIYSGSAIVVGDASCRVTEVGSDTYAAKLTEKVRKASRHKSELMTSIMKIIKILTVCILLCCIVDVMENVDHDLVELSVNFFE